MGGRKWVEQTECREEDDLTGEEEEEGWSKRHQYSGLVLQRVYNCKLHLQAGSAKVAG